jgi:hypothetical protein
MRTAAAAAVVTPAVAVPALALTPTLFPPSPHMAPAPEQVPFFVVLAGINALALGLGLAFVAFGLPTMRRALAPAGRGRAAAAYLAVAWLLLSWYPHGGLHASNGMDTGALLWIEYGFHVPLVIAPLVLIWALTGPRSRGPAARAAPGTAGAARDAEVRQPGG